MPELDNHLGDWLPISLGTRPSPSSLSCT